MVLVNFVGQMANNMMDISKQVICGDKVFLKKELHIIKENFKRI